MNKLPQLAALILTLLIATPAVPQSTHSNIKDPELAKRHKMISKELLCVCGCGMVLDNCNHTVCIAWTMRDIIDNLLLAGKSDEFIISGFINGFGDIVHTDPAFVKLQKENSPEMTQAFVTGFGEVHRSYPHGRNPEIMILLAAIIIGGSVGLFIKKRLKTLGSKSGDASPPKSGASDSQKEDLYKKLYDDE